MMSQTEHGCQTTAGRHKRPPLPRNDDLPMPPVGVLARLVRRARPAARNEPAEDGHNGDGVLVRLFRCRIQTKPPVTSVDEDSCAGPEGRLLSLIAAALVFFAGCTGETPPPMETSGDNGNRSQDSKSK